MKDLQNLVSVGELMRELGVQRVPQVEFLRRVKVNPVENMPSARGHRYFILRSDADMLRSRSAMARQMGHGRGWWSQNCRHTKSLVKEGDMFADQSVGQPGIHVSISTRDEPTADLIVEQAAPPSRAPRIPTPRNPRRSPALRPPSLWDRFRVSLAVLMGRGL